MDEALQMPHAVVAPVPLDRKALQRMTNDHPEAVPPMLRRLVRQERKAAASGAGKRSRLAEKLSQLAEEERTTAVLEAVRAEVAAVLGLPGADAVPKDRPLQELGLDSLMAVEVRNRLSELVGEKLPASILFDHPTPVDLARGVGRRIGSVPDIGAVSDDVSASITDDEIRSIIALVPVAELRSAGILDQLLELGRKVADEREDEKEEDASFKNMELDELIDVFAED